MAIDNIVLNAASDHLQDVNKSIQNEFFYIGCCMCEAITRLENSYLLTPANLPKVLVNHLLKLRDAWQSIADRAII